MYNKVTAPSKWRVEAVVEEEEEEESAVQRGGLPARPLNHSQVCVVTQSGVSVQSSISRWDSDAVSLTLGFWDQASLWRPGLSSLL